MRRAHRALLASLGLVPALLLGCDGDVVEDPVTCEGPTETQTPGVEACSNGIEHRVSVETCTVDVPRTADEFSCNEDFGGCMTDADCTDEANGFCSPGFDGGCFCQYGCETDDDCGAGSACLCGAPAGICITANCATDEDCPEGLCTLYVTDRECDIGTGLACTTVEDECLTDGDCGSGQICDVQSGVRVCTSNSGCAIGRPFLVGGRERLAPTTGGDASWTRSLAPDTRELDRSTRAALAARWSEIGAMEHASIAAFARFTLQLLSLGAPPELVSLSTRAMEDETRHARAAFGLASAYAGEAVGPGALPIAGALDRSDLETVVETLFLEGCVGETVAAAEARECAASAECPVVRGILEEVAADEQEHANLAWRALQWLLVKPETAVVVRRLVGDELARCDRGQVAISADGAGLERHGIIGEMARGRLRADMIELVVAPCVEELLAAPREGSGCSPREARSP